MDDYRRITSKRFESAVLVVGGTSDSMNFVRLTLGYRGPVFKEADLLIL